MDDRQALQIVALSGTGEQDIGRQTAVFTHPALFKSGRRATETVSQGHPAQRPGLGGGLSAAVIANWQAKGGNRSRMQDRRPVLQRGPLRHGLPRSKGRRIGSASPNRRPGKPQLNPDT
jgi:hypothetical protein